VEAVFLSSNSSKAAVCTGVFRGGVSLLYWGICNDAGQLLVHVQDAKSSQTSRLFRTALFHNYILGFTHFKSDRAVGTATGYGLDDLKARMVKNYLFLNAVKTDSGSHLASYTMGTGGSFLGVKAAGTRS
jgi:hypothetical protein